MTTIIHFSEFNHTAWILASPLLRTSPLSDRTSVQLPTWWLAVGRVGLEFSSHPLGNIDKFHELSARFPHPEFSSARLGSGMNYYVSALAIAGTNLDAGGQFTTAGGIAAKYVASWDGSSWSALGAGMDGHVNVLAVSGSDLYAGGDFTTAGERPANYIAKWDGSAWSALGSGMGWGVSALALSGPDLYAGGWFTMAGGSPANYIAKWDGSAWSALGSGMGGEGYTCVRALAVSGSSLYAGGIFTSAGGKASGPVAEAIIEPGNWLALQFGVPAPRTNTLIYVGLPNSPYLVQFATNLTTSPWFTLATNTPAANGRGIVQDPTATDPQRFYRVGSLP